MLRGVFKFSAFHAESANAASLFGDRQAAVQAEAAIFAELFNAGKGVHAAFAAVLGVIKVSAFHADAAVAAVALGVALAAFRAHAAVLAGSHVHADEAFVAARAEIRAIKAVGIRVRGAPFAVFADVLVAVRAVIPRVDAAFYAEFRPLTAIVILEAYAAPRAVLFILNAAIDAKAAVRTEFSEIWCFLLYGKTTITVLAEDAALLAVPVPVRAHGAVMIVLIHAFSAVFAPGVVVIMAYKAHVIAAGGTPFLVVPMAVRTVLVFRPATAAFFAFLAVVLALRTAVHTGAAALAVRVIPRAVPAQAALVAEIFFERRQFE